MVFNISPDASPSFTGIMVASVLNIQMSRLTAVVPMIVLLLSQPGFAEGFESLAKKYRANDAACQNMSGSAWQKSCEARDIQEEQLLKMGAFLCGRRDWYPSKTAAMKAGC